MINLTTDIDQTLLELLSEETDPQVKDRIQILRAIGQSLNANTKVLDDLLTRINERTHGTKPCY
jgi:hypothetical protein